MAYTLPSILAYIVMALYSYGPYLAVDLVLREQEGRGVAHRCLEVALRNEPYTYAYIVMALYTCGYIVMALYTYCHNTP